jgi:membrane protein
MLLIVVAVAGLVFGDDAARGALSDQLRGLMGADGAKAVEGLLTSASKPSQGIVATVTGVVVLLIGATSVFGELQDALDRVWDVPARAKPSGIWGLLRSRFLSLGMILGIAFMLMVSLVVSAAVAALGTWWSPVFGDWEVLAQAATFVFGFAVTTVGFALIYRLMPHAKVQWRDVWVGAVVTSLLFSLGRFVISLYIGKSGVTSGFGAAGSLIVVFVWVYYSAQIFLLGAEFTWVYATEVGSMKGATAGQADGSRDSTSFAAIPAPQDESAPAERTPRRPPSPREAKAAALILVSLAAGSVFRRFVVPRMGKGRF